MLEGDTPSPTPSFLLPTHQPLLPTIPPSQLQEIHDAVMREAIAKHGGYEIITEGDSFSVAFTSGGAPRMHGLGARLAC